jgi:hypothetical protein
MMAQGEKAGGLIGWRLSCTIACSIVIRALVDYHLCVCNSVAEPVVDR